eukprot:8149630-Alexandrium_andersonii.AAC.1
MRGAWRPAAWEAWLARASPRGRQAGEKVLKAEVRVAREGPQQGDAVLKQLELRAACRATFSGFVSSVSEGLMPPAPPGSSSSA